ncbi:MAG: tetratricopeptide repeat protein [Gemmataceae bacterium]
MNRGLWTAAVLVCCLCVETTKAQIIVGGGGFRLRYHRGPLTIQGSFGRGYYSRGYVFPPTFVQKRVLITQPQVTVVAPPPPRVELVQPRTPDERFGGSPSRRDPYEPVERVWDTRGVDFDLVTPDLKPRPKRHPPEKSPDEPPPPIPLPPGKDVSKPRRPIRPDGKRPNGKNPMPMPKPMPRPKPEPNRPLTPQQKSDEQLFLGAGAFRGKEFGLAAQRFRIATQLDPRNADAWFHLAQARFALGQYLLAIEAIRKAMDNRKDYPIAPYNLRRDLYPNSEPTLDAHLDRLAKAVKADPNNGDLAFLYGHQLWFDGKRDDARRVFARARTLIRDVRYIDQFFRAKVGGAVA